MSVSFHACVLLTRNRRTDRLFWNFQTNFLILNHSFSSIRGRSDGTRSFISKNPDKAQSDRGERRGLETGFYKFNLTLHLKNTELTVRDRINSKTRRGVQRRPISNPDIWCIRTKTQFEKRTERMQMDFSPCQKRHLCVYGADYWMSLFLRLFLFPYNIHDKSSLFCFSLPSVCLVLLYPPQQIIMLPNRCNGVHWKTYCFLHYLSEMLLL